MPDIKWVFDTVSLSNFIFSEAAFILEDCYKEKACITREVFNEISTGISSYPKLKMIDTLIDTHIFNILSLSQAEHLIFRELIGNLGKGESSCIAIAKTRSLIVVTDDRAARNVCIQKDIPITGTIGILKAAVVHGELPLFQANEIHQKMVYSGFYSPIRSLSDIVEL
jgi:predicted nucleic acid-binding protein